ncbi:MAG: DNA primase [Pikeienuella sp.]
MALPPGFLDEIRSRVSIAKVIERKLLWDSKKSNAAKGDYWACCPFHQEKSSSFHVEDRKGFYYCFGCHAKGDAITFLMEGENMSFMEAVETLAAEAGMPMPAQDPRAQEKQDRRTALADVMEHAAQFYRLQFKSGKGQAARDYIQRRGLSGKTVERFEIGYAPDTRTALREHLGNKGVEIKQMDEAGLVIVPDDGGQPYDRFRGRIMFPIRDARGRCIAFGGRAMDPNARAKYLNSPETALFDKGRSLYNHGNARSAAGKIGALIVAEGYMDVIALAQAGFDHAVAPLGTAVTEDQLRLMWRIADEPVIALDGDKAGVRAAMRVIDIALPMLEAGKSLRFAIMPEGQDPDDLIKASGASAMQDLLDKALPMVELLWRRETEGEVFDSPERRAGLDARLRKALSVITDPGLRGHYGQALKERRAVLFAPAAGLDGGRPFGGGSFGGRQGGFGAKGKGKFGGGGPMMPSAETKMSALAHAMNREAEARGREATLLLTLINHPKLADKRIEALEDTEFMCRDLDVIRGVLLSALLRLDGAAQTSSDILDAMMRENGENPLPALLTAPQAREARFAHPDADSDFAEHGFDEILRRHRALLGLVREVGEAEQAMSGDPEGIGPGEEIDLRLQAASEQQFRDGKPGLQEVDGDETELTRRLDDAIAGRIWEKKKRPNNSR